MGPCFFFGFCCCLEITTDKTVGTTRQLGAHTIRTIQQEALERDRRQLQSRLLDLVATAADASQDDRPLWGPVKDPIDSLWAFVSWKPTAPDKSITKTSFQTSPVRNTSSQVSGMETPSPRPPPLHPASPMQTFTKDWQRGEGKGGATTPTVQSLSSLVSGGLGRG